MKSFAYVALFVSMVFLCACPHVTKRAAAEAPHPAMPPFHKEAPKDPLLATKDPSEFRENRVVFVAYSLATRIEPLLYQVPCYCPCRRIEGHTSLLDCFKGNHGVKCAICQKELLLCYRERRRPPEDVRQALARGEAWKIDLDQETKKFYPQVLGRGFDGSSVEKSSMLQTRSFQ